MAVLRSILSFLLLVAAGLSVLTGSVAQWADNAARTSGPLQEIVGPVSRDAGVQAALSSTLTRVATDKIPTISAAVPGIAAHLETLIGQAVEATLADEGIDQAWVTSIDTTRAGIVSELDAYADDPSQTPTLWFDLTPFVDVLAAKLGALTNDQRVEVFITEMDWTDEVRVPLGRPDASQLDGATQALEVSAQWRWFYAAGAVLALVGLAVGTRRARWVCLLIASLLTAAATTLAAWGMEFIPLPSGSTLAAALVGSLADGALTSLSAWLFPVTYGSLGVAAFALVALIVVSVIGRRAPAS
ncbi:hypothetical protein [Tessaracoccus palaemonis]|uniref:Integral membrane protein n=1 Tax=Tessaracoccus palaemonis TaxID=2829499 RepID=A0ABX8SRS5_9ACTN|nr:hypothetical protein [Tessaracoccus palaemonis]QXT63884.1 hypothetical protein KDB89_05310 [Tessaracoccus palaemonis]